MSECLLPAKKQRSGYKALFWHAAARPSRKGLALPEKQAAKLWLCGRLSAARQTR
jgi:hypothetical protein